MLLGLRGKRQRAAAAAEEPPIDPRPWRHPGGLNQTIQAGLRAGLTYELGVDSSFDASHAMRPDGAVHAHSFRVQASFVCGDVDERGMVAGFREVTDILEAEAKRYANQFLNEIEPFTLVEATGANIAAVIYRNVQVGLAETMPNGARLLAVTLWNNPASYVRVSAASE